MFWCMMRAVVFSTLQAVPQRHFLRGAHLKDQPKCSRRLFSPPPLFSRPALSASVFAAPTTVEGTGVGKHGDITVAVTFDAGKIQDIKIVKNAENPILAKKVFTDLKDQVVALSSTDVDLISGAHVLRQGLHRRRQRRCEEGRRDARQGRQEGPQERPPANCRRPRTMTSS